MRKTLLLPTLLLLIAALLATACGDVREYDVVVNGTPASVTVDSTGDPVIVTVATATATATPQPTPLPPTATPLPTATPSPVTLYEEDFALNDGEWHSQFAPQYGHALPEDQKKPLEWYADEGGFARSKSAYPHRWWLDGNQACLSPWYALTGEQPCWGWHSMIFIYDSGRNISQGVTGIDLTNATVEITLRSQDHLGNAGCPYYWWNPCDLKFFVQGPRSVSSTTGQASDFIFDVPADSISLDADGWHVETVVLNPENATCMGTASIRADTYNCDYSAAEVLADPWNMMLIMGPLDIDAIAANQTYPIGQIDLGHVRIIGPTASEP